ncbi:MAG: LacI family transcriptional regulator [Chloroflexi bacterium HGW-Chloroflexi-10]|nr:MAG: LacI family transcriptional regulator [Chloroflexi bacterium HGW-Chloroflexi-10]
MSTRVTLKTISEHTGLSVTTVSRALTGYDDVAVETRDKIMEAAAELGYYPNLTARQLQKQRTDTIGLILPTSGPRYNDPYFSELIAGIGDEMADYGLDLLLSTRAPGSEEIAAYRHMVEGKRVDGLIVVRTRKQDERIAYLAGTALPFVAFGRSDLEIDFPYIDEDGESGFFQLTQHLISQGHTRIGFISAPLNLLFANYRLEGYQRALKENNIPFNPEYVIQGDLTRQGGDRSTRQLLQLSTRPTAIIAANDLMALSALSVAREYGLKIGRDISIAGFDDVPPSDIFSLTTLRQPIYDIGRLLSAMLFKLIQGEPLTDRHLLLKPKLIIRQSTGQAPQS